VETADQTKHLAKTNVKRANENLFTKNKIKNKKLEKLEKFKIDEI
jgi:hypothetical protein